MNSFSEKTPTLVRAVLIFLVSYVVLSTVFLMSATRITGWMLPVYANIIEHVFPEYQLVSFENAGGSIKYKMEIRRHIKGTDLNLVGAPSSAMNSSFQFVTIIIYYSLLFAWPALTARKKIVATFVSLPLLILFVLVDIPVTIINSIDTAGIQELKGIALASSFQEKAVRFLCHFINNGGRQFYAVLLFLLTILPFRLRFFSPPPSAAPPSSGKGRHGGLPLHRGLGG